MPILTTTSRKSVSGKMTIKGEVVARSCTIEYWYDK